MRGDADGLVPVQHVFPEETPAGDRDRIYAAVAELIYGEWLRTEAQRARRGRRPSS